MVTDRQTNSQEDRTEVLLEEEATSTKPAPEGTEIPLHIINSIHYNQDKPNHIHESKIERNQACLNFMFPL